mmetsp:Transcript_24619/g.68599  ORF Transcript_24619/g.68599 Transcript_24619/m.68599 type:complete len:286 (+) Transcript_24619:1756-2613(+)
MVMQGLEIVVRLGLQRVPDRRRKRSTALGGGDALSWRLKIRHEVVALINKQLGQPQDVKETVLVEPRVLEVGGHEDQRHLLLDTVPHVPLARRELAKHLPQHLAEPRVVTRCAVGLNLLQAGDVPTAKNVVPVEEIVEMFVQLHSASHEARRVHAAAEVAELSLLMPPRGRLVRRRHGKGEHALPGNSDDALEHVPEELLANRQRLVGRHHAVGLKDILVAPSIEVGAHCSNSQTVAQLLLHDGEMKAETFAKPDEAREVPEAVSCEFVPQLCVLDDGIAVVVGA